jgi:AMP phosphorylase
MKFKVKKLNFLTGKPVCLIHESTAMSMSLHVGKRVSISKRKKRIVSVVDTTSKNLGSNEIAVSEEIIKHLHLKIGENVEVDLAERPHSISLINKKLNGERLRKEEIQEIIEDIADNSLTEVEVAFFVAAVYSRGMNLEETRALTNSMVESGNQMRLKGKIVDKHCIGGVAGNRTTPIIVSICAAAGLKMPKTSSRAITSAAGTADVIETITRIEFPIKEIKKIVNRTNACFVWGGALGLAPVDDKIIKIETVVYLDSTAQLLASILSKKISVGSRYILIDIPHGKSAKVSKIEAEKLKKNFLTLAKSFRLKIRVILTKGSEPIGRGIGPYFEINDVIKVLERRDPPRDLEEKSLILAGELLELSGKARKSKGIVIAREILDSGKAFEKFKEIVNAQGGDIKNLEKLKPKFSYDVLSSRNCKLKHIDNKLINKLARAAGCPEDHAAGIYLHKKKGESVKKREKILTIYSVSKEKMKHARRFYNKNRDIIDFY